MDDERTTDQPIPDPTPPETPDEEAGPPTPDAPPADEPADEAAPTPSDEEHAEPATDGLGPWDIPDAPDDEPLPKPRRPAILRPWEALEYLDRQWEDRTPVLEREHLWRLALTDREDPRGWDFIGALTGDPADEVVTAYELWLTAQLAADAAAAGRAYRPLVMLVPAGRLWHVVRCLWEAIVIFDGPGYPTPGAAVRAAAMRYRAELRRDLERAAAWDREAADASDEDGRDAGQDEPSTAHDTEAGEAR